MGCSEAFDEIQLTASLQGSCRGYDPEITLSSFLNPTIPFHTTVNEREDYSIVLCVEL